MKLNQQRWIFVRKVVLNEILDTAEDNTHSTCICTKSYISVMAHHYA